MAAMLPSSRLRILVVDDDRRVLRGLQRSIVSEGHLAVTAQEGRSALEMIAGGDYEILQVISHRGFENLEDVVP
jgi:CheY-like chemotaxis protein